MGVSVYLGAFPGGGDVTHIYGYSTGTYNTALSFGGGVHYRSVDFIHSTRLNFSLETQWIDLSSDPVDDRWGEETARYDGYAVPVLLWCELVPDGRFGPLVRIGAGAMLLDLSDEYTDPDLSSRCGRYWSFALGLGGGIYYSFTDHVDLLLIIQGMIGTQGRTFINESDVEYKLEPYAVYFYGFDLRYWF